MKRRMIFGVAGTMLMSYFGVKIGTQSGAGALAPAMFALGILLMASAPVAALGERVLDLERQLAKRDSIA